jgi:hypothetical protein
VFSDLKVPENHKKICCFCFPTWDPLFNWIRLLWRVNDDQMQKMNGTDYTLYLVYLRYAAYFCFIITLINMGVMIPMYVSGEPAQEDNWKTLGLSSMNNLTILNITASQDKFDFVYVFTILVVSSIAYCMIF